MNITFTLSSIIKNESEVLPRMLDSVKKLVTDYVIVDTGSTDNTIPMLLARNITPHFREFTDFGESRTHALQLAFKLCGYSQYTYIVLLDADMELVVNDKDLLLTTLQNEEPDIVLLYQSLGSVQYKNIRMIKASLKDAFYEGCTHEYIQTPEKSKELTLPMDVVYIKDHGDGGCKSDKFERDKRLLEAAINSNPCARYTFYLAQTYKDLGEHQNAINMYHKRIDLGGWIEEVCFSRCCLVDLYLKQNEEHKAVEQALLIRASGRLRPEPFHSLCEYYRNKGDIPEAVKYFSLAQISIHYVRNEIPLFYDTNMEEYHLPFQEFMLWYYIHTKYRGAVKELAKYLLNHPKLPSNMRDCVKVNYDKFYALEE